MKHFLHMRVFVIAAVVLDVVAMLFCRQELIIMC